MLTYSLFTLLFIIELGTIELETVSGIWACRQFRQTYATYLCFLKISANCLFIFHNNYKYLR